MWNVTVRNTFLDVTDEGDYKFNTLKHSKSDPGVPIFSLSASADTFVSRMIADKGTWSFPPVEHSEPTTNTEVTKVKTASSGSLELTASVFASETCSTMDDSEKGSTGFLKETLPSLGSAVHCQGECVPCTLFQQRRCRFGQSCTFCHFQHQWQTRPNRKTRDRRKRYGHSALLITAMQCQGV